MCMKDTKADGDQILVVEDARVWSLADIRMSEHSYLVLGRIARILGSSQRTLAPGS